jgi:hypothetical protein
VSIYASIEGIGGDGDPEHLGQPWQYAGSHILPTEDGPRGGGIGLAIIPSHISRDGRDDQPEDEAPWPWLRFSAEGRDANEGYVDLIINPAQARHLAEQLATWADQADPPEFAGGQHWWIDCQRGGARWGGPGSSDRDATLAKLTELRAKHPDTLHRLVCETTRTTVEDA